MKFNRVKWVSMLAVVALLVTSFAAVGLASAQDELPPDSGEVQDVRQDGVVREIIEAVATAAGLTPEEVLAQVNEGKTLAEIAQAAGADVDAIIAEVVAAQTGRLEDAVKRLVEQPLRPGLGNRPAAAALLVARDLIGALAEATGKTAREIIALAPQAETAAALIEAAGADVSEITDKLIALEAENINQAVANGKMTQERADELLANLETRITDAMNKSLPDLTARPGAAGQPGGLMDRPGAAGQPGGPMDRPGAFGQPGGLMDRAGAAGDILNDVMDTIAQTTDKTARDLLQEARAQGLSLGEVLTANGVDVAALTEQVMQAVTEQVNQAVADGKMTQARADQLLQNLPARIDDLLNRVPGERPGPGGPSDAPPAPGQ